MIRRNSTIMTHNMLRYDFAPFVLGTSSRTRRVSLLRMYSTVNLAGQASSSSQVHSGQGVYQSAIDDDDT